VRHAHRRAISLLEVLISMGILTIGLLSVAALIPVGHHHVATATRYDRAASIGQAAFGEIKTRGLLRLERDYLLRADGTRFNRQNFDQARTRALAVDPLWCSQSRNPRPGNPTPFPCYPYTINLSSNPVMERVTLATLPGSQNWMTPAVAEQLFMSHDDLALEFPPDRDRPSLALHRMERATNLPLQRQFLGDYTWMFTVVPVVENSFGDLYTVSVVVFHKRRVQSTPSDPAELMLPPPGNFSSGPGLVEVEWASGNVPGLDKIRPGHWVMLSARNGSRSAFRWYRLMMVQNDTERNATRMMLSGPQWPDNFAPLYVSIFEGAVAVYEKTMHIDGPSMY
jgi:hypothetical protein